MRGKVRVLAEKSDPDPQFLERMEALCRHTGGPGLLAQKSRLSRRVIDKYRNGESDPSRQRLIRMADAGGVSVEWLATGRGAMVGASATPGAEVDEYLLSRALEGVRKVYQARKVHLPAINEAEIASHLYRRVAALARAEDEQRGALLMALDQLDRELAATLASEASGKRSA